jgi:hypothetical protein
MSKKLTRFLAAVSGWNLSPVEFNSTNDGHAKPRRALMAIPPRETGRVGADSDYPKNTGQQIEARQYADQIPFVFCPETFGTPFKNCDDCGGDSYRHGFCNSLLLSGRQTYNCFQSGYGCGGYYCKCQHDGQNHDPRITSTTVVNGQTGTVVYEPITLTQYSNLRYHTTVTLTDLATTTTSDGATGLETALAVVFAGGIGWLAVCKFVCAYCVIRIRTLAVQFNR